MIHKHAQRTHSPRLLSSDLQRCPRCFILQPFGTERWFGSFHRPLWRWLLLSLDHHMVGHPRHTIQDRWRPEDRRVESRLDRQNSFPLLQRLGARSALDRQRVVDLLHSRQQRQPRRTTILRSKRPVCPSTRVRRASLTSPQAAQPHGTPTPTPPNSSPNGASTAQSSASPRKTTTSTPASATPCNPCASLP